MAYRPRSRQELTLRLRRRFPEQTVQEALDRLASLGLVDDAAFAQFWVERRARSPRSRSLLVRELRDKGIPREEAEELVQQVDEEEGALVAARKAARRNRGEDYAQLSRRVCQYLRRRGFSSSVIRKTLARVWREGSLDTPSAARYD